MIDTIILIRPRAEGKKEFPFALLYVGTALKNKGYKVEIIDLHDFPEKEDYIIERLASSPNIMLGIGALAPHYGWVKKFTLKVKKKAPRSPVIIGGHISVLYQRLLENTGVDYVCLKEGEGVVTEVIEKINAGASLEGVPGIAFRSDGKIINTGFRPYLQDFLMPDYELIDIERYLIHPNKDLFFRNSPEYQKRSQKDDKLAAIMFSRGCVGACGFCYRHLPGFRQASIDWSWKNIMFFYEKYGVKYFRIDDELFINNPEWFQSLHEKIIESKINILFRISGIRVDKIGDKELKMLKEMGCISVNYGIESGSQTILDAMNKRTTVFQNISAIQRTLNHGMQVMAYVMFGYEKENEKTLKETLDMLLKTDLAPEYISLFYTIPLPGTRLYYNCLEKGLIKNEENFLESIFDLIGNQHNRYVFQLGEVTANQLFGFEKKFWFLLNLKDLIGLNAFFKLIYKITFLVPYDSRLNEIFNFSKKIITRIRKKI